MSVKDALIGIKNLLANDGWIKGQFNGRKGEYCLLGALNHVLGPDTKVTRKLYYDCRVALSTEIMKKPGFGYCFPGISAFNDHLSTTFKDVVEILDEAIKNA